MHFEQTNASRKKQASCWQVSRPQDQLAEQQQGMGRVPSKTAAARMRPPSAPIRSAEQARAPMGKRAAAQTLATWCSASTKKDAISKR